MMSIMHMRMHMWMSLSIVDITIISIMIMIMITCKIFFMHNDHAYDHIFNFAIYFSTYVRSD